MRRERSYSSEYPSKDFSLRLCNIYIVRGQFTRHVLRCLRSRLRSLRPYVLRPLRMPPRDILLRLTRGSTGSTTGRAKGPGHLSTPHPPSRNVSLNPRYPRVDLLGNLSSSVDDIRSPRTQLGSLMTSRVTRNKTGSSSSSSSSFYFYSVGRSI